MPSTAKQHESANTMDKPKNTLGNNHLASSSLFFTVPYEAYRP